MPFFESVPPISAVEMVQERYSEDLSIQAVLVRLAEERGFIHFYMEEDPYTEWLGNYYPIPVAYNGLAFLNSEAAFQAQKFIHLPDLMSQFSNFTADQAFRKARELSSLIRSDWRQVNVQVMREVLHAKIDQNPSLASWLDATGHSLIVEHNLVKGRDAFWSDDFDGTGKNMLGILWMELRAEMRGEPASIVDPSHMGWQNYRNFLDQIAGE